MSYYSSLDVHNVMNWISVVEKDHLYFSGYPNEQFLKTIKHHGFTHIVNLTNPKDNLPVYLSDLVVRNFPITDHQAPDDIFSFIDFTHLIRMDYFNGAKILVHCKAGKGRSSLFCVTLLIMLGYEFMDALKLVSDSYNARVNRMESDYVHPLRMKQLTFLQKIARDFYICLEGPNTFYGWLSLQDDQEFYKYIVEQIQSQSPSTVYTLLYNYLYSKFFQNKELFLKLKFTYLKRIVLLPTPTDNTLKLLGSMYVKILHRIREMTISTL